MSSLHPSFSLKYTKNREIYTTSLYPGLSGYFKLSIRILSASIKTRTLSYPILKNPDNLDNLGNFLYTLPLLNVLALPHQFHRSIYDLTSALRAMAISGDQTLYMKTA